MDQTQKEQCIYDWTFEWDSPLWKSWKWVNVKSEVDANNSWTLHEKGDPSKQANKKETFIFEYDKSLQTSVPQQRPHQ